MEDAYAHVTTSALIVYLIQSLKSWSVLSWVTEDSERTNRILSILAALIASTGITWTFEMAEGTLIVHGLTWWGIGAGLYEWAKQWVTQKMIYELAAKPKVVVTQQP